MKLMEQLAPQMKAYSQQFHTDGEIDWQPYTMFFHPKNYSSEVVNTDSEGFRYSVFDSKKYSASTSRNEESVRIAAGNSFVFGIGATSDEHTIASRLMHYDTRPAPWINFGGRAFNSAQELILISLYRHMLPKVDEILLFSGANNLLLSRLSEHYIQEHGAFYNASRFFSFKKSINSNSGLLSRIFGGKSLDFFSDNNMSAEQRVDLASELTLRHLAGWRAIANDMGAKLTYVLQPVSRWVRDSRNEQEKALFSELAGLKRYTTITPEVLSPDVSKSYADRIQHGSKDMDVNFINLSLLLGNAVEVDDWLFVDHTHLTDFGYDKVANLVIDEII